MNKSKYEEDKRKEELFGKWLDEHFYRPIRPKYKSIQRITDRTIQKQGVDVIIETSDNKKIYIDEKASMHYINENIPTFAFEILNSRSGAEGWLFNENYKTNYYLLAWPNATDISIPDSSVFTNTEIMVIKRNKVIELLSENGLDKQSILKLVEKYKNESGISKLTITEEISLYFNRQLYEKPVNIVIKKKLLNKYKNYSKTIN